MKQRDEVTLKRGRRERLKEAENESRRGTGGRKLESKCRGRGRETKADRLAEERPSCQSSAVCA